MQPNAKKTQLALLRTLLAPTATFSDTAWQAAEDCFSQRSFAAREHPVLAGRVVEDIHFIITGLGRYYYIDTKGREFNKSFSRSGQALSSVGSLVTGEPSPFYVQALEPCECLSIRYAALLELAGTYREWEQLVRRLLELLVIKKEMREADFLLLSATERYRKFLIEFADVCNRIPNYHIASYLGITEVALSRIRGRIKMSQSEENS